MKKSTANQCKEHNVENTFGGLQCRCWQYGSIFIRLSVFASQIYEISRNSTKIRTYSNRTWSDGHSTYTTRTCQLVNHRRAYMWSATVSDSSIDRQGSSWAPYCSLCTLQTWSQWLKAKACHHTCMPTIRRYVAPVVLLQSTPSRRRSPSVSALSPAGCCLADCHWTVTIRKLCGARQVNDNTSFRVQFLTALVKPMRSARDLGISHRRRPVDK